MSAEKPCITCKTVKPISEFYRHPMMADGHLNKCKQCVIQYQAERRDRVPEKIAAYERKRYQDPMRRKSIRRTTENWRKSNPVKKRAHGILNRAVRSGDIKKPSTCEDCGKECSGLHGHHEDYSKPLDVQWLCPQCHGKTRRKRRTTHKKGTT